MHKKTGEDDQIKFKMCTTLFAHQNLPESCPLTMDDRRKQTAMVMQVLKDAAETNENIARGSWQARK